MGEQYLIELNTMKKMYLSGP